MKMINWQNNLIAKLLSLVAAIMLWVYVMSEQNPIVEVTYTVPVRVQNLNEAYLIENAPEDVKVSMSGPRNTIFHMDPKTLVATLDLTKVGIGPHKLPLTFSAPSGMNVIKVSPAQADVFVDEYAVRELDVTFRPIGNLPKDYAVKDMKIVPSRIAVSGAKRYVDAVEKAYIQNKIDTIPNTNQVDIKGNIVLVTVSGQIVHKLTTTPSSGTGTITFTKTAFDKYVAIKPTIEGTPATGYKVSSVEVQPKELSVKGKVETIAKVTELQTLPINIDGASEDVVRTIPVLAVDGVEASANPVQVIVHIEKIDKEPIKQ